MRRETFIPSLVVVSILTIATATGAQVQTKPKAPAAPARAYDKLSLGNQKVASALFQAQSSVVTASPVNGSSPASRPLTLEEIAVRRRRGQTWGQIFRDMKARGLVHERTLGLVVANYLQSADTPPRMVASDTGSSGSSVLEIEPTASVPGAHGGGKGGK
jgi:hypothetical protein